MSRVFDPSVIKRASEPNPSPVVKSYTCRDFDGSECDYTLHADGSVTIVAERPALPPCRHERIIRVIGDPKSPHAHVCECGEVLRLGPVDTTPPPRGERDE